MAGPQGSGVSIREPRERLVASVRVKSHPSQLRHTIASAQDQVLGVIGAEGLAPAGPLFTRYHRVGPIADLEVGVPLAQTVRPNQNVVNSMLPGGSAVHAICIGSRSKAIQTVRALHEYAAAAALTVSGGYWEYYLTDPLPGLDLCHMEFYLPVVGVHTNGRSPHRQPDLVGVEVRPEPTTKSVFARRGPRWEEGAVEIEVGTPARSKQEVGTTTTDSGRASEEANASETEA